MTELRTHDGVPGGPLRADWEALAGADPDTTIFHTPRYLEVWATVLAQDAAPRLRTVHRDGRLVGVVAEAHEQPGGTTLRFLGGTEVSDYLGPVARPEDRDDVAAAWLGELAADTGWEQAVAGGLSVDTGWPDVLEHHAQRTGLVVTERVREDVCPRIDLSDGYDAYLARLPGKQRQEFKRRARKLARDAGELRRVDVAPEDVKDRLEEFFALAVEDDDAGKAGFFRREPIRAFFRALADEFAEDGTFRLHLLEVGGRTGAATVSLVHGGEWGLYNSAFDSSLRMLAPGMVLVGELIELAASEGLRVFDMLRGDEPYKYRFGAVDRELQRLTITRSPAKD